MLSPSQLILRRPPSQHAVLPIEHAPPAVGGSKIGSDGRQTEMLAAAQTKSSGPERFDAGMLKEQLAKGGRKALVPTLPVLAR